MLIIACVFGLLIGSFLNVVICRLPQILEAQWRQESLSFLTLSETTPLEFPKYNLATPASHCPHCRHTLSALENIPVISYLFLRGRCKSCSAPISLRYPLIELFTALITVIIINHFEFTLAAGFALILSYALIAASVIDMDHHLLPDDISLPILWVGLIANLFSIFTDINSAVLGALAGYLSLWSIYWIFKFLTKKEGMGYGDFKLLALLGAWLGWQALPMIILLSSLMGSLIGLLLILLNKHTRATPLPFGPYLALAGFISLVWGNKINLFYLNTFLY